MGYSDKQTINDPECRRPVGATDVTESFVHEGRYDVGSVVAPNHGLAVNHEHETCGELTELERHGSRVEAPSLYRRGKQSDYQFHTR